MKSVKPALLCLPLAAVMLSVCPTAAWAEVLTTIDDTFVRERFPDSTSRSAEPNMLARTQTSSNENHVPYLRFDTSTLDDVTAASLQWYWYATETNAFELTVYGLNDGVEGEVWAEESLTYNTAPGLTPDGLTPQQEADNGATTLEIQDIDLTKLTLIAPATDVTQAEGSQHSVSGTALVDFLNADTNGSVTFILTREPNTSARDLNLTSKEADSTSSDVLTGSVGDFAPTLTVTTVPEPGSLALLATGAACVFARRRGV